MRKTHKTVKTIIITLALLLVGSTLFATDSVIYNDLSQLAKIAQEVSGEVYLETHPKWGPTENIVKTNKLYEKSSYDNAYLTISKNNWSNPFKSYYPVYDEYSRLKSWYSIATFRDGISAQKFYNDVKECLNSKYRKVYSDNDDIQQWRDYRNSEIISLYLTFDNTRYGDLDWYVVLEYRDDLRYDSSRRKYLDALGNYI